MTTKTIKLSNGVVKQMTFEEVLEQFDGMINRFANEALEKIVFNKPEREELLQELCIQVWEAYKRYDGKHAFSTYLHFRLQHGVHRVTMKLYAQKRTNERGVISLNKMIGSGDDSEQELETLFGEEDFEITSLAFREFMVELEKKLDPCEKKMLKVLIDRNNYSVQDFANELGISRQGANKKVNKFKKKMADLMIESGFVY